MRDLSCRRLLDVVTFTGLLPAYPTLSTGVTPASGAFLDPNGGLPRRPRVLGGGDRLVAMDADKMPAQVMFTAKRAATRWVGANMGFETVWIMGGHMCLQVISPGKCSGAGRTPVLLARIILCLLIDSSKGARMGDGRRNGQL